MKTIYFVRHGETEGNVGKYFQTADNPLTEKGHKAAMALAERSKHLVIDVILSSPYRRALDTAEYIKQIKNVPLEVHDSLHELVKSESVSGKRWDSPEGQAFLEIYKTHFFEADWDSGDSEKHEHVLERIESIVTYIENHQAQNILVVSHGQFLNLLIIYLLLEKDRNSPSHQTLYRSLSLLSNVSITEACYMDDQWKLITYNDRAHFAE